MGFVNKILSKPKLYFVSVLTVFRGYFFTLTLQVIFLFPDFTVIVAVPFFFATIFPFDLLLLLWNWNFYKLLLLAGDWCESDFQLKAFSFFGKDYIPFIHENSNCFYNTFLHFYLVNPTASVGISDGYRFFRLFSSDFALLIHFDNFLIGGAD